MITFVLYNGDFQNIAYYFYMRYVCFACDTNMTLKNYYFTSNT